MQYVIKVSRMGIKTVILAMAIGVDKTVSLDIVTQDFTSAAFFPWTAGDRDVVGAYIGEHRVKELASLIKINILQKLISNINKEGYEENEATTSTSSTTTSQRYFPPSSSTKLISDNPPLANHLRQRNLIHSSIQLAPTTILFASPLDVLPTQNPCPTSKIPTT